MKVYACITMLLVANSMQGAAQGLGKGSAAIVATLQDPAQRQKLYAIAATYYDKPSRCQDSWMNNQELGNIQFFAYTGTENRKGMGKVVCMLIEPKDHESKPGNVSITRTLCANPKQQGNVVGSVYLQEEENKLITGSLWDYCGLYHDVKTSTARSWKDTVDGRTLEDIRAPAIVTEWHASPRAQKLGVLVASCALCSGITVAKSLLP